MISHYPDRVTQPPFPPAPPPPPPGGPPGQLRLRVQGNLMLSLITPSVTLSGQRLPVRYGENLYPVVAGDHLVEAYCQWIWVYGRARHPVTIRSAETTELWYAAPALTFLPGAMGTSKQRHRGLVGLALFLAAVLALGVWLLTL